jgi:hypothetical protein
MGADITVGHNSAFCPIDDVTGKMILINAEGKTVAMPLDHNVDLKIHTDLKISGTDVDIRDLRTTRVYTSHADPFQKLTGFNTAAAGASEVEDLARGKLMVDEMKLRADAFKGGPLSPEQQILNADQAAVDTASEQTIEATHMMGTVAAKEETALSGGAYDAIRVSLAVTPRDTLADPYIAIIAQVQDPANKPGVDQTWIHLQSMGRMPAGVTRNVAVYEEGMPSGYILGKCEVHIYNGRDELATSLSSDRVQLTKDEMLDFRVIDYLHANRGHTLPAAPATFARDMRSFLTPAQLNQACYVLVAKNGQVTATFEDKEGTSPLRDQELDAALKGLRFKPAIEQGTPVEAIVPIRLGIIASF